MLLLNSNLHQLGTNIITEVQYTYLYLLLGPYEMLCFAVGIGSLKKIYDGECRQPRKSHNQ